MFKAYIYYLLLYTLILILIANAITTIQEKAILYSRVLILSLLSLMFIAYNNLYIKCLGSGIGLYNGLFNVTIFTQSFNIFILLLAVLIIFLTGIYPNTVNDYYEEQHHLESGDTMYVLCQGELVIDYTINTLRFDPNISREEEDKIALAVKDASIGIHLESHKIIEYALIITFILSGAMFLMSTSDLISLFLSIELQSYGLYILATLYRDSESATKNGLTYFLLGGLSSCFILLGSAILYVNSGTTNLDNIYIINSIGAFDTNYNDILSKETLLSGTNYLSSISGNAIDNSYFIYQANYINLSFTILIVGFLFKISAAPFHFWSPDVYDGIPTIVTTFVAIIAKISLFVVLIELVTNTISNYSSETLSNVNNLSILTDNLHGDTKDINKGSYLGNEWKNILIFSSLASLIVGSLLGLTQYRIKRLFAYSTISHVGFILLALSINKMESIQGYIFYILQYSISNLNAFLLILAIGYSLVKNIYNEEIEDGRLISNQEYYTNKAKLIDRKNSPIQLLSQMKGYFHFNQFLALSLGITLFSFIGIPPLIGFFAKQMVLSAALDEGYVFMTLIGVITSVIGACYYLNLVNLIFFSKYETLSYNIIHRHEYMPNDYLTIIISTLTMTITLFIFVPGEWFRIVSILSLSICKV